MLERHLSRQKFFWLSTPFLVIFFTIVFASCINKNVVLDAGSGGEDLVERTEAAEKEFSKTPRTTETVYRAYCLMSQVARASAAEDSERYERLCRAAWFAIWLTYYGDNGEENEFSKEAILLCNTAVKEAPDRPEGYYYRAIAVGLFADRNRLYGRDAMGDVRDDAAKALEINPNLDFGGPHRVLGALYLRAPGPPAGLGSKQRAYRHLLEAYQIAPDYPENCLFLAEACIKMKRNDEAAGYLSLLRTQISQFGDAGDQKKWAERAVELEKLLRDSR